MMILFLLIGVMQDSVDTDLDKNLCGLHSANLIITFIDSRKEKTKLYEVLGSRIAPYSYLDLADAVEECGFRSQVVEYGDKREFSVLSPCILHIRGNKDSTGYDHFLPCFGETEKGFVVAEFPGSPFYLPRDRLYQIWDGKVMFVFKDKNTVMWCTRSVILCATLALLVIAIAVTGSIIARRRKNV